MSFMYEIELKDGSRHIYESPESDPEPSDEYWEFFDNHRDEVADLFSVHLTGLPTNKEEKSSLAQSNGNITTTVEWHNNVLKQIFDEIVERFGGCDICEWFQDYDYDENNISEYRSVGDVSEILDIIKRYTNNT